MFFKTDDVICYVYVYQPINYNILWHFKFSVKKLILTKNNIQSIFKDMCNNNLKACKIKRQVFCLKLQLERKS